MHNQGLKPLLILVDYRQKVLRDHSTSKVLALLHGSRLQIRIPQIQFDRNCPVSLVD